MHEYGYFAFLDISNQLSNFLQWSPMINRIKTSTDITDNRPES